MNRICVPTVMPKRVRCGGCAGCQAVKTAKDEAKELVKNKKMKPDRAAKKVKQLEYRNKCTAPLETDGRRVNETERLRATNISGGEYRTGANGGRSLLAAGPDPPAPRQRPGDGHYDQTIYDTQAFDEYLVLVQQCEAAAVGTSSEAVKLEAESVIPKMRSILQPSVRPEVDYDEAAKDMRVLLALWSAGNPAGSRAFIPTTRDRDMVTNALQILSAATEERTEIVQEYVDSFGYEGVDIYNELLSNISEEDKKALPFVNMCLRAWRERLEDDEDGNLWADLSLLNFEEWVKEELGRRNASGYKGKTSYELMMRAFSRPEDNRTGKIAPQPAAAGSIARDLFCVEIPTSKNITPARTPCVAAATNTPNASAAAPTRQQRTSKLQKLGELFRDGLLEASRKRRGQRCNKKADERVREAVEAARESSLPKSAMRECREAAKRMEDILFSSGGAERIVATLRIFKDRPVVAEAAAASSQMVEGEKDGGLCISKDDKFNAALVRRLKEFLGMFNRRGRRKVEDQNAYNAVMAAVSGGEMTSEKMARQLARKLEVSYRQIKRGRVLRKDMEDMDTKAWIRVRSKVSSHAIKEEHRAILSEALHTDEFSRIDNSDKTPVVVDLGICPDTGARMYDLHERRELYYGDFELLDKFTGRNRIRPEDTSPPHPAWINVISATTNRSRPNGIKGSTKLIRQCKCKCMKKMKASVCACPKCTRLQDALRVYHKTKKEWRRHTESQRKMKIIEERRAQGMTDSDIAKLLKTDPNLYRCAACDGACRDDSVYSKCSASTSSLMDVILCGKVRVPELDMKIYDKNWKDTGRIDECKLYREQCCYGRHCHFVRGEMKRSCGWDATFSEMPEQTYVETDDHTGAVTEHTVRACPDEFGYKGRVIWSDFVKVVRTRENRDGGDDDGEYGANEGVKTQLEWLPVSGSAAQFLVHLQNAIDDFVPHIYEVRHSHRVKKKEEQCFLHMPAIEDDCPEEYKNIVSEQVDFSSVLLAQRAHDLTCSIPEKHQCEVHILTGNPRLLSVDSIATTNPRTAKALKRKKIEKILRADNIVVNAFSKVKPSAAYNATVTDAIVSIAKHGKLPDDSKCEAFIDGVRIPGGDRTGFPDLPEGLTDAVSLEPLFECINRWRRWRDGCAAQYQGKSAFRAWQTMMARHELESEDCRNQPHHGKCRADGATHVTRSNIKASFDDAYEEGTQNLVRHLALKYPRPIRGQQAGSAGLYSPTRYVYIYVPEDGINESLVATDDGYDGSSRDYYYRSKGATMESSRLYRRERVCGCDPCLQLKRGCLLTPANWARAAGTIPLGSNVNIKPKRPVAEVAETRRTRKPLGEFAAGLSVGENVILRVHPDDRAANPNDEYFIGKVVEQAKHLDAPGTYSSTDFYKNDWIVKIRWYTIHQMEPNGDRLYKYWGHAQYVLVKTIVQNIPASRRIVLERSGDTYKLSRDLDEYICRYGDINV